MGRNSFDTPFLFSNLLLHFVTFFFCAAAAWPPGDTESFVGSEERVASWSAGTEKERKGERGKVHRTGSPTGKRVNRGSTNVLATRNAVDAQWRRTSGARRRPQIAPLPALRDRSQQRGRYPCLIFLFSKGTKQKGGRVFASAFHFNGRVEREADSVGCPRTSLCSSPRR